ncbi:hypothetical protein [Rhodococcus marinonascens]|uniref:hypothetical protein n=1 Tax=Rhodococcus marinonascens TaxID=38311 RepID=UPI0011147E25|nr:hypothetical protein [Rhodococcus marinonascens]
MAIATDASQVSRVTELVDAAENPATIDGFVTPNTIYHTAARDDTSRPCSWHLYTVTASGELIEHYNGEITSGDASVHMGPAFDDVVHNDAVHNDLFQVDNCLGWVRL